jgi:hypothetical protein
MNRCGTIEIPGSAILKKQVRSLSVINQNTRAIIPIVIHVLGDSQVQNSITENVINDQIKQLNQDFSKTNSDSGKVPAPFLPWAQNKTTISFELRQTIRKSTTQSVWNAPFEVCLDPIKNTSQGGSDSVDTEKNLNVWIVNISELLGYATFPWWREFGGCYTQNDGVVINYQSAGSIRSPNSLLPEYGLGRTLTHELGHYLGLYHMWNDCASDVCCRALPDLPAQKGENSRRPTFPHRANSCPASPTSPASQHGDMFMNYMDYVFDDSMYMFSQSQMDEMLLNCSVYRPSMIKQFNSTSTSTINLSGLNASNNSDTYQCIVNDGSSVIYSDRVSINS